MKKIISIVLLSAFSLSGFATEDIHLTLLEKSESLLEAREGALTLEQVKELAAGENVDARIAYEKLYQAHQSISQARADYFPYGAGDVAIFYFTNFWNPLILAELVTSVPSKWHNVARAHHLKSAQEYNLLALKENVKNQVAQLYFNILKEEGTLKLTGYQVRLLEEKIKALYSQIELGLENREELVETEYFALKIRDEYLKLKALLVEEKAALKLLLNMDYDSQNLAFQPVSRFLDEKALEFDIEEVVLKTAENAPEIKAAQEMVYAASRSRSSTKWSILSFSGLGFDYLDRVRMAGSKLNESILLKEAVIQNVENEVRSRKSILRNAIVYASSEREIMERSKYNFHIALERYKAGHIGINELVEAGVFYIVDFRRALGAHYDSLARMDDMERASMGPLSPISETEQVDEEQSVEMVYSVMN